LKIVMEHISTAGAVEYVNNGPANLAASITAHHLLYNRNGTLRHVTLRSHCSGNERPRVQYIRRHSSFCISYIQ